MSSFWPTLCRGIDLCEGLLGVFVNLLVLFLLWRYNLPSVRATYRIGLTVTAVQGTVLSMTLPLFGMIAYLCHEDRLIIVHYGPVALLPREYTHYLVRFAILEAFCTWEMVPASCILQYLALCKSHYSSIKKLCIAYGTVLTMIVLSLPYLTDFSATPELQASFDANVIAIHSLNNDDIFVACGATMYVTPENPISMLRLLAEAMIPSYCLSYLIFVLCAWKIRQKLRTYGSVTLSTKTEAMQRRFFVTLVFQTMLPLVVMCIPLSVLSTAMIGGIELDQLAVILAFFYFVLPIVQGSVSLVFVRGLNPASPTKFSTVSSSIRSNSLAPDANAPEIVLHV